MAKCANCTSEAFFTYAITGTFGINYCSRHVPKFLQAQKNAGMLPLRVDKPEPIIVVEPTPVVEEPIVEEEPVVEPEIEEAVVEPAPKPTPKPAPKKKAAPKKKTA